VNGRSTLVLAAIVVAPLIGCGGDSSAQSHTGTAAAKKPVPWYVHGGPAPGALTRHIVVKPIPHIGLVLVNGKGFPLYAFVPDRQGASCTDACASTWPVFTLMREHVLDSSPELPENLIRIEPEERLPERTRVVSYAGYLLHSYTRDTHPLTSAGVGLDNYGGRWYLLSIPGRLVGPPGTAK